MIETFAVLLILAALANTYFVWDGLVLYIRDPRHSPILLALLIVKSVVWATGLYVAILAARYLLRLPPLPFAGFGLTVVLAAVEALPSFIHLQMRRIIHERGRD